METILKHADAVQKGDVVVSEDGFHYYLFRVEEVERGDYLTLKGVEIGEGDGQGATMYDVPRAGELYPDDSEDLEVLS